MYKIINNKEEYLRQYNTIMSEYQSHFNLSNENIICEQLIHCSKYFGALDLSRLDLFESLKETSSIINDEWLNSNIVNTLESDWFWKFETSDSGRVLTKRVKIPLYIIVDQMAHLIDWVKSNSNLKWDIDEKFGYVFTSNIEEPEMQLLGPLIEAGIVSIEYKIDI